MALKTNDCPCCASVDTVPYPFGDGLTGLIYREVYPDARVCVDCEHVWWRDPFVIDLKSVKQVVSS